MAEPINLNRARKARAKAESKTRAAENRVRFGQTKVEKAKTEAEQRLAARRLDQHERE